MDAASVVERRPCPTFVVVGEGKTDERQTLAWPFSGSPEWRLRRCGTMPVRLSSRLAPVGTWAWSLVGLEDPNERTQSQWSKNMSKCTSRPSESGSPRRATLVADQEYLVGRLDSAG